MRKFCQLLTLFMGCALMLSANASPYDVTEAAKKRIQASIQSEQFQAETQLVTTSEAQLSEYKAFEEHLAFATKDSTAEIKSSQALTMNEMLPNTKTKETALEKSKTHFKPISEKSPSKPIQAAKKPLQNIQIAKAAETTSVKKIHSPKVHAAVKAKAKEVKPIPPVKKHHAKEAYKKSHHKIAQNKTFHKEKQQLLEEHQIKPYVGMAYTSRNMPFEQSYGGNVFSSTIHNPEVYAGIKIFDWLGFEVGYSDGNQRHRSAVLSEDYLTIDIPSDENSSIESGAKVKTFRADVLGFIPLSKSRKIRAIIGAGLTSIKTSHFSQEVAANNEAVSVDAISTISFNSNKTVLNAMLGLEYNVLSHLAIRGTVRHENTSKIGFLSPIDGEELAKPKNSTIYSIGVIVN